jgi:hypothetical protein
MVKERARMLAAVVALCSVAAPAGASAQQPGVYIDPQSPAGVEYALPLPQARGDHAGGAPAGAGSGTGGPGGSGSASSAPDTTLFGAGIRDQRSSRRGSGHSGSPAGNPGVAAPPRELAAAAGDSGGIAPAVAGVSGFAVLAALGLGLGLRRRSRVQ